MRPIPAAAGFLTALLTSVAALAAPATMLPTNLEGVRAYPAPPAGFDPQTASAADLHRFGFPPRPSFMRNETAYDAWKRQVNSSIRRITPVLSRRPTHHLPMIRAYGPNAGTRTQRNAILDYAKNWSGAVIAGSVGGFGSTSIYTLWGEFNLPIAQQPFGTCSGTDYSAVWIGIDGYDGSSDVLQAGGESDASCYGGITHPNYYLWFEWYPGDTYMVMNLSANPGDDIALQIVADSSTTASLYITDETTNQSTSVNFTAPAGTQLTGNSAEWILERPEVGNSLSKLTNYVTSFMGNLVALQQNGSPLFGAGGNPSFQVHYLTMLDDNDSPISYIAYASEAVIALHDEGSAR